MRCSSVPRGSGSHAVDADEKSACRIFQHLSVPDILRQVFTGLDVSYQIAGKYYPGDYCVQYRESDYKFASRLMEEEGIYYFFKHADGSHQLLVTDIKNPTIEGQRPSGSARFSSACPLHPGYQPGRDPALH